MSMLHLIQFSYQPDGETRIQVRQPAGAGHQSLVCILPALTLSAKHRHALSCWPSSDAHLDVWRRRTSTVIRGLDVRSPIVNT